MRAIRAGSLCFALVTVAALYGAEAEYLGGTAKSIPSNMTGKLDLSDPSDLVFTYGKGLYRLPFEKIRSFEITPEKSTRHFKGAVLNHVPVPRMPWGKQAEVLNLSFRGEDKTGGVLSFRLTDKDLSATEWALKSRIGGPEESATNAGRSRLPESWWGDRYWRTTRSIAQRSAADTEGAGTK